MTDSLAPHPLASTDLEIEAGGTRLRPVRRSDVTELFRRIHGRDDVLRWLCWRGPRDLAHLEARYVPPLFGDANGVFGVMLAVVDAATDGAIGEVSLTYEHDTGVAELGYWLGADAQGRGHGTRLVDLAADLCLERIGSRAVTASIKEGNDRSLRALARAGFVARPAPPSASRGPLMEGIAWIATLTPRGRRAARQRAVEERA